ncbi:unnamed protein product [Amoebophrya sp. A120]|nr:unnamed protein product [Amoebophrya sp. A120]|eukprot:GSA120T00017257001.1
MESYCLRVTGDEEYPEAGTSDTEVEVWWTRRPDMFNDAVLQRPPKKRASVERRSVVVLRGASEDIKGRVCGWPVEGTPENKGCCVVEREDDPEDHYSDTASSCSHLTSDEDSDDSTDERRGDGRCTVETTSRATPCNLASRKLALRIRKSATFFRQLNAMDFLDRLKHYPHRKMLLYYAANRIWPSALALVDCCVLLGTTKEELLVSRHGSCNAVDEQSPEKLSNPATSDEEYGSTVHLLELGCGLGVTGMLMHKLGWFEKTVLTDLEEVVAEVEANIARNFASQHNCGTGTTSRTSSITACPFDWTDDKALERVFETLLQTGEDSGDKKEPSKEQVEQERFGGLPKRRSRDLFIACADCIHKPLYGADCVDFLYTALSRVFQHTKEKSDFRRVTALVACEHRSPDDGVAEFMERVKQLPGRVIRKTDEEQTGSSTVDPPWTSATTIDYENLVNTIDNEEHNRLKPLFCEAGNDDSEDHHSSCSYNTFQQCSTGSVEVVKLVWERPAQ